MHVSKPSTDERTNARGAVADGVGCTAVVLVRRCAAWLRGTPACCRQDTCYSHLNDGRTGLQPSAEVIHHDLLVHCDQHAEVFRACSTCSRREQASRHRTAGEAHQRRWCHRKRCWLTCSHPHLPRYSTAPLRRHMLHARFGLRNHLAHERLVYAHMTMGAPTV